ncbi:MAG: GNAT family N-acetyltransferase [Bacteroidetes bacterium]|nr:GNAT family N-acetyltransferase [Bacteroidota bacterium]
MEVILAKTAAEYAAAIQLFKEYAAWLNIDLSFQHFDEELANLKKMYNAEDGGILLCKEIDTYIACVAVRKNEPGIAELKRMYVQPQHQHKGIGKLLLEKAIELAVQCNYTAIKLDTLNNMAPAIALYKKYGFIETPPYYFNPQSTAVYFEKKLSS